MTGYDPAAPAAKRQKYVAFSLYAMLECMWTCALLVLACMSCVMVFRCCWGILKVVPL
jgi:hypothetical protein